jgi:hypothetical protein
MPKLIVALPPARRRKQRNGKDRAHVMAAAAGRRMQVSSAKCWDFRSV